MNQICWSRVSSGTGAGNVDFSSTISGNKNLDILSGTGNVIITGNIGGTALASLDINQSAGTGDITISGKIGASDASGAGITRIGNDGMTGTLTFGGIDYNTTGAQTYEADHIVMSGADPDFKTDDDNISFKDGGITLATTSNLTVDTTSSSAGNILIEGAIAGTSDGTTTTVTLEAGSGSVAVAGMGTDIGNVTIDGSGGVTLNGSITTAGGNIDINNAVTLDTADIILTTANGTVDFASTVNADGAEALTIRSGTGNVGFSGIIGGTGSLGALTINATSDSRTGDADIAIVDIGDSDTVGAAATNIGNTNTELITLSGTTFKHGAAVYTTKGDDVIKLTRTAGAGNATFTLSNASLEFAGGNIKLSDGVDLVANTGNKALTVLGVRGTSYEDVTLTTSGTLTVGTGGIGSGTQIEDVSLDGTSIVLKGNITTAGATVGNTNNVGDVDFDGAVTIDGAITITTDVDGSTVNDGKINS